MVLTAAAGTPGKSPDAKSVAQAYLSLWISGETCKGVEQHWDLDRMLDAFLGEDYTKLPESDRLYVKHLFTVFVVAGSRLPEVRAALRGASAEITQVKTLSGGRVGAVGVLQTPKTRRQVMVELVQVGDSWKIVNLRHDGKDLRVVKAAWEQFKAAKGKSAVPEWIETMVSQLFRAKRPAPSRR